MVAPFAILGFENSDKSLGFALTTKPMQYLDRLDSGVYTSSSIEQDGRLRWAVPAQSHGEALGLRDRWNSISAKQAAREVGKLSVPGAIINELYEIWWDSNPTASSEAEALELIGEHGEFAVVSSEDLSEHPLNGDFVELPHACPFIPLPERSEPLAAPSLTGVDLGIKLAIFDLDMTLVDSSKLKGAGDRKDWEGGILPPRYVRPLPSWGGCATHYLPRSLSELGVRIALISRAPRRYVDKIVSMFDIYSDMACAPCGGNKYSAFERVMKQFGASPAETVVFGDDRSDFRAASSLGLLSLGNPWTSTKASVAPDVAWLDAALLLNQGAWHERLRYIGEIGQDRAEWHRGSLLPFDDDAYALGRYFPSKHARHRDHQLTQRILAAKENSCGDPYVLAAFETTVERLTKRRDIDVVISPPPHLHLGKKDRFSPYREVVIRLSGASETTSIRERHLMPGDYKRHDYAERRKLRKGSFEIEDELDGLNVLLIDDVVSSGATLLELKDAAQRAGASKVTLLAFGFNQSVRG